MRDNKDNHASSWRMNDQEDDGPKRNNNPDSTWVVNNNY